MTDHKTFTITSLRATLDQEHARRETVEKEVMQGKRIAEKFLPLAIIGAVVTFLSLTARIPLKYFFTPESSPWVDKASLILLKLGFAGVITTFMVLAIVKIIHFFVTRETHQDKTQVIKTWGSSQPPKLVYNFDEHKKEYDVYTSYAPFTENQYVGRISEDDSMAEVFKEHHAKTA